MVFSFILAGLALSGSVLAVPLATQQPTVVDSLDSSWLQQQIVELEQTVVAVSTRIAQGDDIVAEYNIGTTKFSVLADLLLPPGLTCPLLSPSEASSFGFRAQLSLSITQSHLADLIHDLQNDVKSEDTIASDFCNAYTQFQLVQQYGSVGATISDAFNLDPANPNFPADRLDSTFLASSTALNALISTFSASSYVSASARDAYRAAQAALAAYKSAASPKGGVACQPGAAAPIRSPSDAINRVSIVKKAAETAFADTRENNGKSFYSFCNIDIYMGSLHHFVQG